MLCFSANLLGNLDIKLCKIEMGNGKFVFRNLLAKCDLHSPDTSDTRMGERASANVQPCNNYCVQFKLNCGINISQQKELVLNQN